MVPQPMNTGLKPDSFVETMVAFDLDTHEAGAALADFITGRLFRYA